MEALFGFFFVLLIIGLIIFALNNDNESKTKKLSELKHRYSQSLQGIDKRAALSAGRAYYSALRENKSLTMYDEQAITNDLSTMNSFSPIEKL